MNALIYQGEVSHARLLPVRHSFRYPQYFYAFDIDELPALAQRIPLFGYNQLRPVSILDRDYLHAGNEPLRDKVRHVLREAGMLFEPQRIVLVTAARYFHYVFNPISFFYCYAEDERLQSVVAQVNNTFGEMHVYLLHSQDAAPDGGRRQFSTAKQFHVSPFFARTGRYEFTLREPGARLDNQIAYHQEAGLALVARMRGEARELTTGSLLQTLARYPFSAALTMPRILWQAARLYWQRRLPVFTKPIPDHNMTIRPVAPTLLDRAGLALFDRFLSRLPQGELQVVLPDGSAVRFGRSGEQPAIRMQIHEYRFFRRVMLAGDIGFGEAFTAGEWTTEDLPGLLELLAAHEDVLQDDRLMTAKLGRGVNYLRHLLRANTLRGSARNIRAHYDLSNDFFATFLDPAMSYSAALFATPDQDLEAAQRNKIRTLIRKAELNANDHVLEIGCGWGAFAIEAVRQTGCRVTGITLSHEQLSLARQRVAAAGLEDRIELKLCDYRKAEGQFSKIVSIEMLEAVGHAGLGPFFATCDRVLAAGGKVVLQVITIPDRKYEAYRHSSDWIRKYIFPGGHLPSIAAIKAAVAENASFRVEEIEQYGLDYARTLQRWRQTFFDKQRDIVALGFDKGFLRTWDYYFSYCQAGFAAQVIGLEQLVLKKPETSAAVDEVA